MFRLLCSTFIAILASSALGVDHDLFKTCARSDFCNRLRNKPGENFLQVDEKTLDIGESSVSVVLNDKNTGRPRLNVTISAIVGDIFRVTFDEVNSTRYHIKDVLNGPPRPASIKVDISENITITSGTNKAVAYSRLNKLEFYKNDKLVLVFNPNHRFTFENETTKQTIAFEVSFPKALRTYGIPLHADKFALRTTKSGNADPYRLFNLDTAHYEVNSPMALYGAVPVLYGHGVNYTSGVFFHNAAEMWVDIMNKNDGVDAYFMAESGVMDLFILLGTTPAEAAKQYTSLTGVAPLPQLWSLGYHQCRWNYDNSTDVKTVLAKLDKHDFPVDVMWLDIEYTDGKRYFTWNPENFSNPLEMLANISSTNRKLVVIIDPHIKVDPNYIFYKGLKEKGFFTKNPDRSDYEGDCWPGRSSYIDFLNPAAGDFYASFFAYDKFNGTNPTVGGIWNDMNEPSVFDVPKTENTAPKEMIHHNGVLHRDIHNMYGFLQTKATHKGLMERDHHQNRTFILTRSHFAGSQRYTGMWTGDNTADWPFIKASYQMCLSTALAGISYCGADVGGFFNDPDTELLQRWYQAAIWLPFYRSHANMGTKRREPYLFAQDIQKRIRAAIKLRYAHLPYWYTLFYEHYRTGEPVIRPLFYHYPQDPGLADIDQQLLVGPNILASAISEPGAKYVGMHFPGGSNVIWYDLDYNLAYYGGFITNVNVTLDKMLYYYKSGSIIPRKNTPRRNSFEMKHDKYNLYVLLDKNNEANGNLYIDDTESFGYTKKQYLYLHLNYKNEAFTATKIDADANYNATLMVENLVVVRPPKLLDGQIGENPVRINYKVYTKTSDGIDIGSMDLIGKSIKLQ